jgi:predicted Zn-dependent protease
MTVTQSDQPKLFFKFGIRRLSALCFVSLALFCWNSTNLCAQDPPGDDPVENPVKNPADDPADPVNDPVEQTTLPESFELLQTGKYQQAYAALEPKLKTESLAVIYASQARAAEGKYDEAESVLRAGLKQFEKSQRLRCELALLLFHRGQWKESQSLTDSVLKESPHFISALWSKAELDRVQGRIAEAEAGYNSIVLVHGKQRATDPAVMQMVAEASAQIARWQRKSKLFHSLINEFYPQIVANNPKYWQARLASAWLFLEKYNDPATTADLNSAMAINANAAEIHAGRAALQLSNYDLPNAKRSLDRALQLNENSVVALQLQSSLQLVNRDSSDAIATLEKALEVNPKDEETLGRLAAVYGLLDGTEEAPDSRLGKIIAQVEKQNEHCGRFYVALADGLDSVQRFPAAAKYYRLALERLPKLAEVRGKLGLTLMRLGEEVEAAALLKESFEFDPFNVRVKNMLTVLDVLQNYAVIETDHFVIKFDRGRDELLATEAARYLEDEVYPEIVKSLGYEPPEKSLFEIFNRARNSSGHNWFSARMVGLPFIGTVGACAGKMVAIASPTDMPKKYNWARVLKHEFVHVVNLQQTNFNVPRWFTEGLAVWHEGYPRPEMWNTILGGRFRAGKVYDLSSINFAFARPSSAEDWTLAYCQAELYVEYMIQAYGDDAVAKMLKAYAERMDSKTAIQHCFNVEVAEFEAGYTAYVKTVVDKIKTTAAKQPASFAELQKQVRDDPENADLSAELAYAYLQRKSNTSARRYALLSRKQNEKQPLAGYVLARLYISIGDVKQAAAYLNEVFDKENPHEKVLSLLAALKLKAGDFQGAAELYEIGRKQQPTTDRWVKALAQVYLKSKDEEKLTSVLIELANRDGDNVLVAKKLATLLGQKQDHKEAGKWAVRALEVDILDPEMHAIAARSFAATGDHDRSIQYYRFALRLKQSEAVWHFELATTLVDGGKEEEAIAALNELRKIDPNFPGADVLLESLTNDK